MKIYIGKSDGGQRTVTVDGQPSVPRYASSKRRNVPFDWGIESPGSRHLAEELLADCAGVRTSRFVADHFATKVVSKLPANWVINSGEVEKWLRLTHKIGHSIQQAINEPSSVAEAAPSSVALRPKDFPDFPINPLKLHRPDWLESLRERIKPDVLAKRRFPRPKEVRISRSTDSTGEEAFYVYLIFPDSTPDEKLAWKKIEPMVSWVRNLIWTETGAQLWPYVKVKRQKEMSGGLS